MNPGRREKTPSADLTVRAQPGASRDYIVGMLGHALKVAVSAPPEKGKANQAVERLLAREFGLPPSAVSVIAGGASRTKRVRLQGIDHAQLQQWLDRVTQSKGKG